MVSFLTKGLMSKLVILFLSTSTGLKHVSCSTDKYLGAVFIHIAKICINKHIHKNAKFICLCVPMLAYEQNKCYYKIFIHDMLYCHYLCYQNNLLLRALILFTTSAVVFSGVSFRVCVNWIIAFATSSVICIDINMCVFMI